MLENVIWMIIIMALTAVSGLLFTKNQPKRLWFVILLELALICRYILIFVIYANGTEASGTDGLIYHQVAKDVASQIWAGTPLWRIEYEYTWYTVLVGIQYAFLGINRFAASYVNAFMSILTGILLTRIALNLNFSIKKSYVIGLSYLFMPSMMVWTSDTRKESMTFLITMLIWHWTLKLIKERDWTYLRQMLYIGVICIFLWLSTLLRIYMLYTIGGGLLVGLFFYYLKTKRKLAVVFGAAVLATCVIVTYTTVLVNMRDHHALSIDKTDARDEDLHAEVGSIINVILGKNIPEAINGFLTKPHLENVASITDISGNYLAITIVKLEMVLWYVCMIFAVFGFMDAFLKWSPYLVGMMAFIVSYSLINAFISENVADTYYRYRATIVAPVLLFADYRPFLNTVKSILAKNQLIWSETKD